MEKEITTHIVKGVIITLILIVFGLVTYFTGTYMNKAVQYIQYVILFAGIIWSCILYANQLNNNVTFGNIFAHGFKTTAVIMALLCVYTFISLKFLFPEMQDKIFIEARKNMEAQGAADADIAKGLKMMKDNFMVFAIGGILLMFSIFGAIASLIGAAVAKKKPTDPFTNQTV